MYGNLTSGRKSVEESGGVNGSDLWRLQNLKSYVAPERMKSTNHIKWVGISLDPVLWTLVVLARRVHADGADLDQ